MSGPPPIRPGAHQSDAEYERLRRRVLLALRALVFVTMIGVVGFLIIASGEHGIVDAVYVTIITLTTVGFTEEPGMTLIVMSDADGQRRLQERFHQATGTFPTVKSHS